MRIVPSGPQHAVAQRYSARCGSRPMRNAPAIIVLFQLLDLRSRVSDAISAPHRRTIGPHAASRSGRLRKPKSRGTGHRGPARRRINVQALVNIRFYFLRPTRIRSRAAALASPLVSNRVFEATCQGRSSRIRPTSLYLSLRGALPKTPDGRRGQAIARLVVLGRCTGSRRVKWRKKELGSVAVSGSHKSRSVVSVARPCASPKVSVEFVA